MNPSPAHTTLILVSQGSPMHSVNVYTEQDMGSRTFMGSLSCCYFNHVTAVYERKTKTCKKLIKEVLPRIN